MKIKKSLIGFYLTMPFEYITERRPRNVMREVLDHIRKVMIETKEEHKDHFEFMPEEDFNTIIFYEFLNNFSDDLDYSEMISWIEGYGIPDCLTLYKKYGGTDKKMSIYELFEALIKYTWECRDKKSAKSKKKHIQPMRPELHQIIANMRA